MCRYSPDSFPVFRPSCSTGKAFPLRGPLAVPALTASQYRCALILFAFVFASLLALPPSLPSCCAALFIMCADFHNTMRSGSHCQRFDAPFSHYFRNAPHCPQNRACRVRAQRRASTRPHTSERLTCASWPILCRSRVTVLSALRLPSWARPVGIGPLVLVLFHAGLFSFVKAVTIKQ